MTKKEVNLLKNLIVARKLLNTFALGEVYLEKGEMDKAICNSLEIDYYTVKTKVFDRKVSEFLDSYGDN